MEIPQVGNVVVLADEFREERQEIQEQHPIQCREKSRADEHQERQVRADDDYKEREDHVVHGLARMPELQD